MNPNYEDYRWLTGQGGRRWLSEAVEDDRSDVALAAALRRDLSPERTHLVLEQIELRRRARVKFARADEMFFTRVALEQATDQVVATYKASHFPRDVPVIDLCCGIGGDLAALTARGSAVGVDLKRVHALFAQENARLVGKPSVVVADAARLPLEAKSYWHLDPDRRTAGRRSTRVEFHSPDRQTLDAMLDRAPNAMIKLAPATEPPSAWEGRAQFEWISRRRECRQLAARFGELAERPGFRTATILWAEALDQAPEVWSITGEPGPAPLAREVGRYVFEPDPAILAADLSGVLAGKYSLEALTAGGGYLTGEEPANSPALACFEVLETLPFDRRRVKRLLADRGIGHLEIKARGVSLQPEMLRRQLAVSGEGAGVLLLTRRGDAVTAILTRRLGPGTPVSVP